MRPREYDLILTFPCAQQCYFLKAYSAKKQLFEYPVCACDNIRDASVSCSCQKIEYRLDDEATKSLSNW
eukprot:m.371370 g.371370  ORF g.371370 m.371370 type:complete len:69 (-) comp20864_c0_seq57:1731-1937(-)